MLYLNKLFSFPALQALCLLLLGLTLPTPALARMPEQFEIKAADALLSDIEECTIDSLAGQDKWSCIEAKYAELLRMHLEDVNPSAHWCAAYSAWERGDVALTYERLNLIKAEFPTYENLKIKKGFTQLVDWLSFLDHNFTEVKLRQPLFGEPMLLEGETSAAKAFANWQLIHERHFNGYLRLGTYTFGDRTLVVTADGVTEQETPEVAATALPSTGPGILVLTYPSQVPHLFPSGTKLEWDASLYGVMTWSTETDCMAQGDNALEKYALQTVTPDKPIEHEAFAGTYWVATYLWHNKERFIRQETSCREVVIVSGQKTEFSPRISSTPAMVERQLHPPTQDFLDGMALVGPGLRFDSPTQPVSTGLSLVLEARMTPEWWINASPNWTLGYQAWLDVRTFGTYTPAMSWGFGGTMGRDWNLPTKAGTVSFLVDGGLMLGTGVFGTSCSFNAAATSLAETDMTCGGFGGAFPRLLTPGYQELPASFYGFYGGVTARAMVRWNVKNSGWFVGGGAWGLGQMFLAPSQQDQTATVVFTDDSNAEVPYSWGSSVFLRGQVVPGLVVGGRFP